MLSIRTSRFNYLGLIHLRRVWLLSRAKVDAFCILHVKMGVLTEGSFCMKTRERGSKRYLGRRLSSSGLSGREGLLIRLELSGLLPLLFVLPPPSTFDFYASNFVPHYSLKVLCPSVSPHPRHQKTWTLSKLNNNFNNRAK